MPAKKRQVFGYLTMVKLSPPSILVVSNQEIAQAIVCEIVDGVGTFLF